MQAIQLIYINDVHVYVLLCDESSSLLLYKQPFWDSFTLSSSSILGVKYFMSSASDVGRTVEAHSAVCKGPFTLSISTNAAMMLVILLSLKTMEALLIGVTTHFRVTPLISMRTVSQNCRNVDADAQCK